MSLFGKRSTTPTSTTTAPSLPGAALLSPSRQLAQAIAGLRRKAQEGTPRVLLCGPASSRSIETFHALGCRVTVEGDAQPCIPLAALDESLDLILGFDALDLQSDADARALAAEWARVLKVGGALYLLARREPTQAPPFLKIDVSEDGSLKLNSLLEPAPTIRIRQNADFSRMVAPLMVDEIALRRDGLREILCRKRG
ncbi:MAG: class I SAM-dependent methyltransferase [Acidobacteriota bacterium]